MEVRKALRTMLNRKEIILAPGVYNALTALIAESLGFRACSMGGWIVGAHLAITEPRMTLTETVANAAWIVKAIKIPLIADASAGYGDALHTMRCVKEFEFAGVSAIHIEDQLYPKRASYHKGVKHIIPLEEFLEKLHAALEARADPDFVIIARTDARTMVGGSLKETIRRCQAFVEAGADVIIPMVYDPEELKILKQELPDVPIQSRSRKVAEELGLYGIVTSPHASLLGAVEATMDSFQKFKETGEGGITPKMKETETKILELIGLPEYYKVEEATTEK